MSYFVTLLAALLTFSTAYADVPAGAVPHTGSPWSTVIMLLVFFAIFYFLLIRPQTKRAKEHKNLIANLARGDEVLTSGGIVGKITDIEESFLTLEVAANTHIKVQKNAISTVLPKGTIK
jgi:preprotein translocase subunit YajC